MKIHKNGQSVLSDIEKSIYSYNNLVENLNAKCETLTPNYNNVLDVRCVGSNPLSKGSENTTLYTSSFLQNNPNVVSYVYTPGSLNDLLKSTDTNYEYDCNQMQELGIIQSDNSKAYWLASRVVDEDSDNCDFKIRHIFNNGEYGTNQVLELYGPGINSYTGLQRGVRPVISITSGLLDNASGSGISSDPFIIQ